MVSRGIYELIEAEGTGAPSLNLEIYHKNNDNGVRELHGNIVLFADLYEGDTINLGWLFSPEKDGAYDGMDLTTTATYSLAEDFELVFAARDVWQAEQPFTNDNYATVSLSFENNQNWSFVGEKSSVTCPASEFDDRCKIKAHWFRKFDTEDSKDWKIEKGLFKGYEIVSYFRISNPDENIGTRANFSEKDYILMGAANLAKTAFIAAVATYATFAF